MAKNVTLSAAQEVVEGARAKADEIGVPMNIAVVDDGNNLTAFARMDGAWLGSIDIAQNKASALSGSMSSSTATIHLPAKRWSDDAAWSARQISLSGVRRANWIAITA